MVERHVEAYHVDAGLAEDAERPGLNRSLDEASASAGTNDSAPTSNTVPANRRMNSGPSVGRVPDDGGTSFLRASEPAIARVGLMIQYRATNMQMPPAVVKNVPLAVRPANAEPLLFACEVNA